MRFIVTFYYQFDKFFQWIISRECYDLRMHFMGDPMAKKHLVDAYFRFLNLAQAVQALPSAPRLDAAEARLLEALTVAWHAGKTLTVTETMALSVAGAPATVHRKLARLRQEGLVSVDESGTDLRSKTVVPTRKALAYYERLAACLDEARHPS
jgi:DNA-binding MarR family transcriptional regulator